MKTIIPANINTLDEAKSFLTNLHINGEAYHPEDSAETVENNDGRLFTDEESVKLNILMDQIYNLDGNNGDHRNPKFDPCCFILDLTDPTWDKIPSHKK